MPEAKLTVLDEVNIKIDGLDPATRRKLVSATKYEVPGARYQPQVRMGRWDGKVSFCSVGGASYLNLLDTLLPIVEQAGYEIILDDQRNTTEITFNEVTDDIFGDRTWPIGHPAAGQQIKLRDYQTNAARLYIENLQSIQEISTGAGKTILTAALSYAVETADVKINGQQVENPRTIVIVPNKDLVNQTLKDYKNVGLDVGVFYGDLKQLGHQHTLVTWQSLNILKKMGTIDGINVIETFIEDVVCVIVDECHSAKGQVLQDLLCGPFRNVPIRWGMTGTIPEHDYQEIAVTITVGTMVNTITTKELQDNDVLSKCNVNVIQMQDPGEYKTYPEELSYLLTNQSRMIRIAQLIEGIRKTGNTLVLVDRIKAGELLEGLLEGATFISGSNSSKERTDQYDKINAGDNELIIASYGIAAVGINIPRIFNLVMLEPGKSFIKVIQTIGRGVRKAEDKDHVEVWDLTSSLKFSKRHLAKRKAFYKTKEFPFTVTKVPR